MTTAAPTPVFNARDAKMRFGQLLDAAMNSPVAITRNNRHVAYIISKRDFDAMATRMAALEARLAEAEADHAAFELALRANAESVASLLPVQEVALHY
ncbi:MAG TPA: type II toxin-antitoxin system prevent-host-death family antitoxin [Noviherbaspirillum sp.]|jgi:prevent-host-death family protein|uniref:type II toxin-antitoxin system prevent-host-death family antitoxin n=1 Tax=Noviherbaspirillum sp. TaxID=1926288 RepID=UPI002DDCC686|nr:type II toxin-antitoxin system prevent-host-death family antitoxin [Noviherbaspirillum sp.]HEV2611686.1 type II toxin-antitoxin system prevent-host-death family antitoxin [Noviherbaspirillum sp.]